MKWDEVERSVAESKKQRSGGGRRFMLQDGQTAEVRFIGTDDEPFIYKTHFDKSIGRDGGYVTCAEDEAKAGKHDGCVGCTKFRSQGKGGTIKGPQRRYAVSLFDPRKFHIFEEATKKEDKYKDCTDDTSCRYCRKNVKRAINGVEYWSMAENTVNQLRSF